MRKRCNRTPRPIKIPLTRFRSDAALNARLAYETLRRSPDLDAFNRLVDTFNIISVAVINDHRFAREQTVYGGATRALDEARQLIAARVQLPARLLEPIRHGVNIIDDILPLLDLAQFRNSELAAVKAVISMNRLGDNQ